MASNNIQQHLVNEKRSDCENEMQHFATISKSIGKIVKNSTNEQFKSDICNVLNVKMGCRKKIIQTKTMKLMKTNYSHQANQQHTQKKSNNEQTNDKE